MPLSSAALTLFTLIVVVPARARLPPTAIKEFVPPLLVAVFERAKVARLPLLNVALGTVSVPITLPTALLPGATVAPELTVTRALPVMKPPPASVAPLATE